MLTRWLGTAVALVAIAGCDDDSTSGGSGRSSAPADALWKLAPEGARGGIVMSPYALSMIESGSATLRSFFAKAGPELAPLGLQIDQSLSALPPAGSTKQTLADFGLTHDKGAALFFAKDGMVAVLPIANRDAFLAKANGTKSTTPDGPDRIDTAVCKQAGNDYICATSEPMLASVGKGTLASELAQAGARGDIEVIGTGIPLDDKKQTSIVAVAQLERGSVVVRGAIVKPPADLVAKLGPPQRPKTPIGRTAGFGVLDLRPLLADAPPIPLVDTVTIADVVKTFAGPLYLSVPAGSGLDMSLPLSDAKPAQTVLAKCDQSAPLQQLGAKLVNGTCHFDIPGTPLALDVWIDGQGTGSTLRFGKKGPAEQGKPLPMSKIATELATHEWAIAFWGRGTMFAPSGRPAPAQVPQIDPLELLPIRVMSLINEAGIGVRAAKDKLEFVVALRLSFANSDEIVAKLVDIAALDIFAGKAADKAKPIVDANGTSLFAGDYTAGETGMFVPSMLINTAVRTGIPALLRWRRGDAPAPAETPTEAPIQPGDGQITTKIVHIYAERFYPEWKKVHPDKPCPTMKELAQSVADDAMLDDEWSHPLELKCDKDGIVIHSAGPDGKMGTPDDIKSR